jgi:acetyltransferase-like isoleucine patch superfamily enzyme
MFVAPMPGGLGLALRKLLYSRLFASCGRGVIIGRNVVLRHPHRMQLADHVTIDDNCLLDGRGDEDAGLVLGEGVILNRGCLVQAKGGAIRIGERTTIGSNSVIVATRGAEIGAAVMFAGGCSVSAGAYQVDGAPGPIMDKEATSAGPVRIGDGAWLGTSAVILDGIRVGAGAVIGAGAIVNRDVPDNAIAAGVPAKVLRQRRLHDTGGD